MFIESKTNLAFHLLLSIAESSVEGWDNEVYDRKMPSFLSAILLDQLDPRYFQNAVKPLLGTVKALMELRPAGACKFILGYVSRFKRFDTNHIWGRTSSSGL